MDNTVNHKTKSDEPEFRCAESLIKSCILSKRLYEFDHDYSRYKQMKRDIKDKEISIESHPGIEARLDIQIEEMENAKVKMARELKAMETQIINQGTDKLCSAADSTTKKLKQITVPTQKELEEKVYKDGRFENELAAAKEKIKVLKERKLDRSELPVMCNVIDDADQYLQEYFQISTRNARDELGRKYTVDTHPAEYEPKVDFDKLVMDTTEKILQKTSQNISTDLDLPKRAKQALDDYLGSQLIDFILNPSAASESTIYPKTLSAQEETKIRKYHQQRLKIKASVPKITMMENETNETITLFEKVFNSYPVQNLFKNMEHIDLVLKSHREILEFMNDPKRQKNVTKVAAVPLDRKLQIPNTISLNEVDKSITNALATSIVGYTERLYFSDLLERVNKLEERI